MSIKLGDLFPLPLLKDMQDQGYVRQQHHPTLPLVILNYTEHAQFDRAWNPVTRQCRGLIYHRDTEEIVARPLSKFFNYGEPGVELDLTEPVRVTDKLDGSLGILFDDGDGGAVATRGSFTSEQAVHATEVWKARYAGTMPHPCPEWTMLFEIIYPGNRIVCDYHGADDLFLLGMVNIGIGDLVRPRITGWSGPCVDEFTEYRTLSDALTAAPRKGKEGLVVDFLRTNQHVKLKQEDYVALHRLVTGLNERVVWERLGAGDTVTQLCEPLPDEFHAWVTQVADRLTTEQDRIITTAHTEHTELLRTLPEGWTRKDYALRAVTSANKAILFQLLDDRDPRPGVWRTLRPSGAVSMTGYTEDVA